MRLRGVNAGIDVQIVPCKGAAPALTDLLGRHVQAMAMDLPVLYPWVENDKLRALAAT